MKDDYIRIRIEKNLKKKFKKKCKLKHIDMSKVIEGLIRNYMEDKNGCNISNKK